MIKTQRLDYVKGQYSKPTLAQMRSWHKQGELLEQLKAHTQIESVLCESEIDVESTLIEYALKLVTEYKSK